MCSSNSRTCFSCAQRNLQPPQVEASSASIAVRKDGRKGMQTGLQDAGNLGWQLAAQIPPTVPGQRDNRPSAPAFWLGPGKRMGHHDFYSDSME
jgi:hypothetical protein